MTLWLEDHTTIADVIRVIIIFVGFTLSMVSMKIGLTAARFGDWERFCGTVSFSCFIIVPALNALFRFNEPLRALPTSVYLVGLFVGCVAFAYRVSLIPSWRRRRLSRSERRSRRDAAAEYKREHPRR